MRRIEDKIRKLSKQLVAASEQETAGPILVELRDALHQYIERLRVRFADYPFIVERRARNDNLPPGRTVPDENSEGTPFHKRADVG